MPETLDQHHGDGGKGEAGRDDEGHRDRGSRHVLEDKVACRRLGLVDQACEHGILRFPDRAEDETDDRGQREGCHRLILHRLVDGAFDVAGDFTGTGIAQLVHRITCVPFDLSSDLLDLVGAWSLRSDALSERSDRPPY